MYICAPSEYTSVQHVQTSQTYERNAEDANDQAGKGQIRKGLTEWVRIRPILFPVCNASYCRIELSRKFSSKVTRVGIAKNLITNLLSSEYANNM